MRALRILTTYANEEGFDEVEEARDDGAGHDLLILIGDQRKHRVCEAAISEHKDRANKNETCENTRSANGQ